MKTDKLLEYRVEKLEDQIFHLQRLRPAISSHGSDILRLITTVKQNKTDTETGVEDLLRKNAKLVDQIKCGVKTGHIFSPVKIYSAYVIFKCVKCDLGYTKNNKDLTTKERRILTSVKGDKK